VVADGDHCNSEGSEIDQTRGCFNSPAVVELYAVIAWVVSTPMWMVCDAKPQLHTVADW